MWTRSKGENTTELRSFNVGEPSNREFSRKLERMHGTPTKKAWDKFRKVNGNYKPRTISPLERGGNIIILPEEIADHYTNILRATI